MKPANHDPRRPGSGRAKPLNIIYQESEILKFVSGNPWLHAKSLTGKIASSIGIFVFNVPVPVDRLGNVVCGHGRLTACRELGMTEVPTLCLDQLTSAQARALLI